MEWANAAQLMGGVFLFIMRSFPTRGCAGVLATMGLASNCWEVLFVPASLMTAGVIGSVHKSVVGSLTPIKIMFPLYLTTHLVSLNMILHPALHRIRIPIREAINNHGTMCPMSVFDSPGMTMSHTWVERMRCLHLEG